MLHLNISTIKNQLSSVLKKVKKGEEVLIMDRANPVAKITPLSFRENIVSENQVLSLLEQKGLLKRAKKKFPSGKWLKQNSVKPKHKKTSAVEFILKEREESPW